MDSELINIIKEVGFPIAVAAWVLVRLNGKLDKLTQALERITDRFISMTMESHNEHSKLIEEFKENYDRLPCRDLGGSKKLRVRKKE